MITTIDFQESGSEGYMIASPRANWYWVHRTESTDKELGNLAFELLLACTKRRRPCIFITEKKKRQGLIMS